MVLLLLFLASAKSVCCSDRFKLDAVALNKSPEEVFDVVGKLGEGYHFVLILLIFFP